MAYQKVNLSLFEHFTTGSGAGQVIDAANEAVAFICQAPVTGSITGIVFQTSAHTTNGNCTVSLQTVDAANGSPTGTLVATDVSATVSITGVGQYTATFTTSYSATCGEVLAVVITWSSGNYSITASNGVQTNSNFPYSSVYLTSWSKGQQKPMISFIYGSTYYGIPGCSGGRLISASVASSSNPNEYANQFTFPFACKISGVGVTVSPAAAGRTYELNLYDSDSTSQRSYSVSDTDFLYAANATTPQRYLFSSEYEVAANTMFMLGLKPTTTSANTFYRLLYVSSAHKAAETFAEYATYATRQGTGSWTTDTAQLFMIWPLISEIDFGGSSSGGSIGGSLLNRGLN